MNNLLYTYHYVYSKLNKKDNCDIVYFDFSKAFDKVPIDILLSKLSAFGVDTHLINLISTLLIGRKQIVNVNGNLSDGLDVTSGVPQGSPISPTLFNIFINDLLELKLNSKICGYADDIKIFNTPGFLLQADIDLISSWALRNQMVINVNKTFVIRFGKNNPNYNYLLNGSVIETKEFTKDLGLIVDDKLKFLDHIRTVKNKCFKMINIIF